MSQSDLPEIPRYRQDPSLAEQIKQLREMLDYKSHTMSPEQRREETTRLNQLEREAALPREED